MGKKLPIFHSALLLTGVNLLLRFVSTSFQVFLSGRIGAAGIGMLQLVLSVGALSMTVGMGGIRTATMYLCAEVAGRKQTEHMIWVLSGCILYSIVLSSGVGFILYRFAPQIAAKWIGDSSTVGAVKLLAGFLPVNCLCGVMVGYFTGVNRIGTLAAVEVVEQIFSMVSTVLLLTFWASSTSQACMAVILGSGMGACFTLTSLLSLKRKEHSVDGKRIPVQKKIWETAVPLAIADDVKAGISTTENLMVPKRLALYPAEGSPLAAFGTVCGMVFPVLMFPAAILFGLAELLIPELARCNAAGSSRRIRHLAERSILITLVYGAFCGGILFLAADDLCLNLYKSQVAGRYLRWFSVLAPMLYCDAIVDAIVKGLGKQKISVRYNILTSALDVGLLFVLLPRNGIVGYFISFTVTHLLNLILSIRLLLKLTDRVFPVRTAILCLIAAVCSVYAAGYLRVSTVSCLAFSLLFVSLLTILGVIKKRDLRWIRGLLQGKAAD